MKDTLYPTKAPQEKAFLVGVELKGNRNAFYLQDSLDELAQLCKTAGVEVVGQTTQKLDAPHPNTYIGKGKLEEVMAWKRELDFDVLVFDEELQPRQQRELEEALNTKVIDRTALILDIFAQHAHTREGQLQVELAQYEYRMPRLTRMWTHLARQAGGGGGRSGVGVGLRGPGETQLEIDRRDIRARISHLKKELEHVRTHRRQYRQRREVANLPVVAIVGYTNAGKSTLFNALSNTNPSAGFMPAPPEAGAQSARQGHGQTALAENKLFATLDPTTRRVRLPSGHEALFTDTVGFIQKLPTTLVAAFRATLEEIGEADLLLHVVDATHPNVLGQSRTVTLVLKELEVNEKPIVTALNKMDRFVGDQDELRMAFPEAVMISAARGEGLDALLAAVEATLEEEWPKVTVELPFNAGELVALFHQQGDIEAEAFSATGTQISGRIPPHLMQPFRKYLVRSNGSDGTLRVR